MTINQKNLDSSLGFFFEDIFDGYYEEPEDCPLPPNNGW